MGRQFENVSARYGAPMGRISAPDLKKARGSVRLFRVNLCAGGYDDGGAYWGHGGAIYAAVDSEGDLQTVRASSRLAACFALDLPRACLKSPPSVGEVCEYAYALLDGRCPLPQGKERGDIFPWLNSTPDPEN